MTQRLESFRKLKEVGSPNRVGQGRMPRVVLQLPPAERNVGRYLAMTRIHREE